MYQKHVEPLSFHKYFCKTSAKLWPWQRLKIDPIAQSSSSSSFCCFHSSFHPSQVCEHHDPSPVPEASWGVYLVGAEKSQKLKITENSEAFSPDHVPGSLVHNTFIHMLEDNMSPDGIDMTRNSNFCFVDTVQNLLCATRPLVFS